MLKILLAYIGAVAGAFLLGSVMATQFILGNVQQMGMAVSASVRLQATAHDIIGLATSYLPLVAIALLIALPVAGRLLKFVPSRPLLLYVLAGFVALVTLHLALKAALGLSGIAATRTTAGLLSQGLAGAVGGYLYYTLRRRAAVDSAPSGSAGG